MALPALTKTWQYSLNNVFVTTGSALTDHRQVMRGAKNALIGFGSTPWAVRGSSNSTVAALDSVDRWAANGDLVWADGGSAHSWIVLRQAGIATNTEVCIDLIPLTNSVQGPRATIVYSATAGFTGGSTTARPTATDEIVLLSNVSWMGTTAGTASFTAIVHARMSTDGQATRVIIHMGGVPVAFWLFDKPQSPCTGWATPTIAIALGATSASDSVLTYAKLWAAANGRARVGATNASIYFGTLGHGGLASGQRLTAIGPVSSEWPIMPMAVISETAGAAQVLAPGAESTRGVFDLFYGSTGLGSPSDYYPSGGSKTFVQHGCLILPNNGSIISTT